MATQRRSSPPSKRREVEAASPARLHEVFEKAVSHHRRGDLRQAERGYRRYLKHDGGNAEVCHALGSVLFQRGDRRAALFHLEKACRLAPENVDYRNDLGALRMTLGDHTAALEDLDRVVALDPDNAQAHYNRGMALYGAGRHPEAIAAFQEATRRLPSYAAAHYNLGVTYQDLGHLDQAEAAFRAATRHEPRLAEAHHRLGQVLEKQYRRDAALPAFERAYQLDAKNNGYAASLAEALHEVGRTAEGIALLNERLAGSPEAPELLMMLGRLLHTAGSIDEAEQVLGRALENERVAPQAALAFARIRKFGAVDEAIIERLGELLGDGRLDAEARRSVHFALGKIHDDRRDYDEAFTHYAAGNALRKQSTAYDRRQHEALVDATIEVFSSEFFSERADLGSDDELPIFIVGMPRSGTTLTEQIVASHRDVVGAGELAYFSSVRAQLAPMLESELPYPRCCSALGDELAGEIVRNYIALLRRRDASIPHVTDKMPGNYLNLGLIRVLFSKARIIHCRRDPMDVCLSIFFQNFTQAHDYANDLTDIAHRYVQYLKLMAHWQKYLPGPLLHNTYEDVIGDQEGATRRLLAFCDLEWDPQCLSFHRHERDVKTASNWQVRQPIYGTARQRWKHYRKHLQPTLDFFRANGVEPEA